MASRIIEPSQRQDTTRDEPTASPDQFGVPSAHLMVPELTAQVIFRAVVPCWITMSVPAADEVGTVNVIVGLPVVDAKVSV